MRKFLTVFFIVFIFCAQPELPKHVNTDEWVRPEVVYPDDNPLTDASIKLGEALFSESLLSKDKTISCQSCHLMTEAFADHLPLGEGIKGRHVTRNTPTVFNVAFHPYFMADGKFATLEDQVMGPINEHREFDMTADEVVKRLKTVSLYNKLSKEAYGTELTIDVVQKSIANFERILISDNSKFDHFMRGEKELTPEEMKGWKLFNAPELNCIKCHSGYNFTNYTFENNGLSLNYSDSGRAAISRRTEDLAKFKIPTLRNIAITHPYMHDGSIESLDAVIAHYASGGKKHPSQSHLISGFEISQEDQKALIAFLKTLTEERLLNQY